MNIGREPKIVLLGMMTRMPVAGVVWQTVHYLVGFRRMGYDVHYVEAHARAPSMFIESGEGDDGSATAAAFIEGVMRRFGLEGRWAYHALHTDGRCYGMSESQLGRLYASAALLINLHGGTEPLPEHSATGRLVYLGTDPVQLEVELSQDVEGTIRFLEPHCAFFSFGENYGNPDCKLPVSQRFRLRPTRQPVVLDFWEGRDELPRDAFTTIGNWRQPWREIRYRGETYHWSKHHEFLKFLDLPGRANQPLELALSSCEESDRSLLESHGWRVREALPFSTDLDAYRRYIVASRGEFTVAKDQNVRLRSGWFSDRSTTYLAAGRPVITQDTGFGNILPTGQGLFAFSTLDEILDALESIRGDYERHRRAAFDLAREYFSHDVVLGRFLSDVGLERRLDGCRDGASLVATERVPARDSESSARAPSTAGEDPWPSDLVLIPLARCPTRLPQATVEAVLSRPVPAWLPQPAGTSGGRAGAPAAVSGNRASIVVVTLDNLAFNRLCLESVIANTDSPSYEIIVVDNGSQDGTTDYLRSLARRLANVRVVFNERNLGFSAAANQGLAKATGDVLVLLNNDTVVPRGWLAGLIRHLEDPGLGAIGPVTNRIGNEAEIAAPYVTYGELVRFARDRSLTHAGRRFDVRTATMFCMAMRREVHERIGPLDERFEIGLLEDDDYAMRARAAGYAVACAADVFVHHFDKASFGSLIPSGEYAKLLRTNRRRFEEKWGVTWQPYPRSPKDEYQRLVDGIQALVRAVLPPQATVLVVSRGDDELLDLGVRQAWHFPQTAGGVYAGHHPADAADAVGHLEALRARGGDFLLFPATALWWLDHYRDLRSHLEERCSVVVRDENLCVIYSLRHPANAGADAMLQSASVGAGT